MVFGEQATVATENNGLCFDQPVGELLIEITALIVITVSTPYLPFLPSLLPHQSLVMEAPVGCIVSASGCDVQLLSLSLPW